jgi:hypothetical protein
MAYIGRQNLGGAYRQLDDISSGFDGSDTTHTMQVNSQNVTVGDVNQIILSLGGVIQKPGTDFTVSGSVLTFTTAPAANTSFFAVLLGSDNGGTVTPTDGSVTGDKVASTGAFTIGAGGTASSLAGIPFYRADDSIYTHDVSGTDSTAQYNTAYGVNALDAITTSDYNVAIGYEAGSSLTTHNSDVLIGYQAGKALSTGDDGVIAIGYQAGLSLTTCSSSVFIGKNAGDGHDTEDHNMGIGRNALTGSVAGGEYNVAIGNYAGAALTSGDSNVFVGYNAGAANTTGQRAVAIGYQAMDNAATSGTGNIVIGYAAGRAITSGEYNLIVGYTSGAAITTGSANVALGQGCLTQPDTESNNIAIGMDTMNAAIAGGEGNLAIGRYTLDALTSGDENIAIGQAAGSAHTTGVDCVYIGESCGGSNVSGSYKTLIGCNADTNGNTDAHEIVIGYNLTGGGQNKIRLGTSGAYIENDYANNANWAHSSDERLKDNIQTDNLGLDFINELRTVTYNWKASDKVDTSLPGYMHPDTTDFDKLSKDTSVTMNGLIAQEVKAALDKVGADASKYAVWSTDDDGIQRISESSFVMPLIKAVQELSAKVKALEDA